MERMTKIWTTIFAIFAMFAIFTIFAIFAMFAHLSSKRLWKCDENASNVIPIPILQKKSYLKLRGESFNHLEKS